MPDRLSELAEALANPIKYQSELDKREHQLAVLTEDTDVVPETARAQTAPSGDDTPQPRRPSANIVSIAYRIQKTHYLL